MSVATLTRETMTPMLPFDFDGHAAAVKVEKARKADRQLCQRYLGKWADSYGTKKRDKTISFAEFSAAAERLGAIV